ncbi:hypothetical protein NL676_010979 [Syzygium grande]|nr:hypothetical protein NL676_010979 [Syzygium grande]
MKASYGVRFGSVPFRSRPSAGPTINYPQKKKHKNKGYINARAPARRSPLVFASRTLAGSGDDRIALPETFARETTEKEASLVSLPVLGDGHSCRLALRLHSIGFENSVHFIRYGAAAVLVESPKHRRRIISALYQCISISASCENF